MYPQHWNKINNNSTTIHGSYIRSTAHKKIQQDSSHNIPQRQEYFKGNNQEKRSIFNQIRHIKKIFNKIISLPTKSRTPYNIGDVVKSPITADCYDSIFVNDEKMERSSTLSAPFLCSLIEP